MFCENCGSKISNDDTFCQNCGHPVNKENVDEKKVNEETNVNEKLNNNENITESSNLEETKNEKSEEVKEERINEQPETTSNQVVKETIKKGSNGKTFAILAIVIVALAALVTAAYFLLFKNKNDNLSSNSDKPIEVLEKAISNMNDLNSYNLVVTANASLKNADEKIDAIVSFDASIDEKNKLAKLNANLDVNTSGTNLSFKIPAYVDATDLKNGVIYFKLPEMINETNEWSKMSLGDLNLDQLTGSTKEDIKLNDEFKELDIIEKVESDIEGTYKYKLVLNEENIKKIAEMSDEDINISEIENVDLTKGIEVYIYVTKKENYLSKIVIDLKNSINLDDVDASIESLNVSIEIKNINSIEKIEIPSEAKNATELELPNIDDIDMPNDDDFNDDDNDNYVENYTIKEYGFEVEYNIPDTLEPSSVNSDDFKIYRKGDELRIIISNYWDSKDERFDDIEEEKEYYKKDSDTKNVSLSEEKTITVNGKDFAYKVLSYEDYTGKNYLVHVCYQLDSEHVYRVVYEKNGSELTDEELKLFLNIKVTNKN